MADPSAAVIAQVVQFIIVALKKPLGIVVSSSDHVRDMQAKVRELERSAHVMGTALEENKAKNLVVPEKEVHEWLEEVKKVKQREEVIQNDGVGCFNLNKRYDAGKKSLDIIKDIENLMKEKDEIKWSDEIKPLAIVSPPRPTTSATVHDANHNQNVIESRVLIFNAALNSLNPITSKTQKLALSGMGGVGKTTMMEQLKKTANDTNMFSYIVKVDVGQKPDPIALQRAVAEYITGKDLSEQTKGLRAERLKKAFEEMSEEGKKNILVMLDDVWESFDLKEIGLTSDLPNGIKLLISSRDENVCNQMGVETRSIFRVDLLKEAEAKKLFWEKAGLGSDSDTELDLHRIGEDIITRCHGLPLAITTIAVALGENKEKDEWEDTLSRLQRSDDYNIKSIFKISYEYLKNDDLKVMFLLCGLFPEDCDISKEALLRYGWGMKLFPDVRTLEKTRRRVNTCANKLIRSNLLLKSNYEGCVKMHDLVRDFVLSNFSNVKQASIVNQNDSVSDELNEKETYERILMKCGGMFKFPMDFNHPNLTLLMLMGNGNKLQFPEDFYKRMEKLEVVAYEEISQPLLPQYLTNLRALSLRSCSYVGDDISFLGDLINLEVLDLAYCKISMLPLKIGNLKKLKLLDLNGCVDLCIDDGVFQSLDKLEELHMKVSSGKDIHFTDANLKELENLLGKLSTLELEFYNNKAQPKYVSFEKLERFMISIGCSLHFESYFDSFKNTLQLETKSNELVECKINELFCKTEVLDLKMYDLKNLEDISAHSPQHSFHNLKSLYVSSSVYLTCLFTISVAKELRKLETLVVKSCPSLKEIWSSEISSSEEEAYNFHMLREIVVEDCNSIVNLFPCNPMRLLSCLEELEVEECSSIEVLFDIDLSKIEQLGSKSNLKRIQLRRLVMLGVVWRIKDAENAHSRPLINCFESVEYVMISDCKKFRNIVTPTTSNFDMRAIKDINIQYCNQYAESTQEQEIITMSDAEISSGVLMSVAASPSNNTMLNFHNLTEVNLNQFHGVEVVFEIKSPSNKDQSITTQQPLPPPLLPYLKGLYLESMDRLTHVWKCNNWNDFSILHENQPKSFLFQNLTTIYLYQCKSIKYLFSPLMVKLLSNLKRVKIRSCDRMEEVVSNRDDDDEEMMAPTSIHKITTLDILYLSFLRNLQHIGGGQNKFSQVDVVSWSLCQYSREICIGYCDALLSAIPYYAAGRMENLQVMKIEGCNNMKEVFETKEITTVTIPTPRNITTHKFQNLKELEIIKCDGLKNIFTFSTLESLKKLETLTVKDCKAMEVIVREENGDQTTKTSKDRVIIFPNLKSIVLANLPNLVGFFLGMRDFHCPLLDFVHIHCCPQIMAFPFGPFTSHRLKHIHTNIGKHNLVCDPDFHLTPASHQLFSQMEVVSWFFCQHSREIKVGDCSSLSSAVPYYAAGRMENLQVLEIEDCKTMKEVFETKAIANDPGSIAIHTTITIPIPRNITMHKFPNLKDLRIYGCDNLEHIFTFSTLKSLKKLEIFTITYCMALKMIVREEYGDQTKTSSNDVVVFPNLKSVKLGNLPNLVVFSLWMGDFHCPLLDSVHIDCCPQIMAFPFGPLTSPRLKHIQTKMGKHDLLCDPDFHSTSTSHQTLASSLDTNAESGIVTSHITVTIPIPRNVTTYKLRYLKTLVIEDCGCLESIFTFSTLENLKMLEELKIVCCKAMKVIVQEEHGEQMTTSSKDPVVFPNLKSIVLLNLPNLVAFFLGMDIHFHCPSLIYVSINCCPQMMVFTSGRTTTPMLKHIWTKDAKYDAECLSTPMLHQTPTSSLHACIPEGIYFSYHNLIEFSLHETGDGYHGTKIFASNDLEQLQKLETIYAYECNGVDEVFEVSSEETRNESQTAITFPKLREVKLQYMEKLKYIWKSNPWRILEFPNLTRLSLYNCPSLEHVFTCSMVGCVMKLQELQIQHCHNMKVIVKAEEENGDEKVSEIMLPCLRHLSLENLSSLEAFSLGKEAFKFPSMKRLLIDNCPKLTVFTNGNSIIPERTYVETSFGDYFGVGKDINSFIITKKEEGFIFDSIKANPYSDSDQWSREDRYQDCYYNWRLERDDARSRKRELIESWLNGSPVEEDED